MGIQSNPLFNRIVNSPEFLEKQIEQASVIKQKQAIENIRKTITEVEKLVTAEEAPLAKDFINKVKRIENDLNKTHPGLASFGSELEKLNKKIIQLASKKTKSPVSETPPKGVTQIALPPPLPGTSKKKITFDAVKDQIESLSLGSQDADSLSLLSGQIREIQKNLDYLEKKGKLSSEQKLLLSVSLDALTSPHQFKASRQEIVFLNRCAEKNPALKAELSDFAETNEKRVQIQARSDLLKAIKQAVKDPDRMSAQLEARWKKFKVELPQNRFNHFTRAVTNSPAFNNHFVKNLPVILSNFEIFSAKAKSILKASWQEILPKYTRTVSDFGELLKNYSYLDPNEHFDTFVEWVQEDFFKLLDLDTLNSVAKLDTYLSSLQTKQDSLLQGLFAKNYSEQFMDKHIWLRDNRTHLVKPYDQATAAHTNLGEGVCFQNCLDRTAVLLKKPDLPSKDLQTGSTQVGRFAQARTGHEISGRLKEEGREVTNDEILKIQTDSSKRLGLVLKKTISVEGEKEKLAKSLSKTLTQLYKESGKELVCVLGIYDPKSGHAINIQLDATTNQFRFIDDNLGVCANYTSLQECGRSFIDYIKTFYPKATFFEIQIYKKSET